MHKKKNIVWLASYPKSGNTWFRLFLNSLIVGTDNHLNINDLNSSIIASNRTLLDRGLGINSSDLTFQEIESFRPELYNLISEECSETLYIKTHDAWGITANNTPIFSKKITKGVLYFIRNPLDVTVSFAFHNDISIEQSVQHMCQENLDLCARDDKLYPQLQQHLYSWSKHVSSWIGKSGLPIHIMKYEDMVQSPLKTFSSALDFLNLKYPIEDVQSSLKHCSFDRLSEQEDEFGFREKPMNSKKFFRKGKIDDWKTHMNQRQVDLILKHHATIMGKFGYIKDIRH